MLYHYKAKNKADDTVEGSIEAESENAAGEQLAERGFFVISVASARQGFDFMHWFNGLFNKVSKKDLAILLRQLAILISAAVPLVQALRILSEQVGKDLLRNALVDIVNEVEGGSKLSSALSRYPDIFSPYFVNMVKSGETSGRLDEILNYLADQQEKDYELQGKISGALMYPGFIITVMIIAGALMMFFVLPKMLTMFTEMGPGVQLPITTRILIASTNFAQRFWWLILAVVVGGGIALSSFAKTPPGRLLFDTVKLKIPVFGDLFRAIYIVRFTRSFSTILVGGVTVPTGLRIVKDVIGNAVYQDLIEETIREVEDGNPISTVFMKSSEVPNMVSQMLAVGEQTGRLDDVLAKITEFYVREINTLTDNTLSLIEPFIMVLLGLAVGVMVSGILLPMYTLTSKF